MPTTVWLCLYPRPCLCLCLLICLYRLQGFQHGLQILVSVPKPSVRAYSAFDSRRLLEQHSLYATKCCIEKKAQPHGFRFWLILWSLAYLLEKASLGLGKLHTFMNILEPVGTICRARKGREC
ncbi:hypothetical protein B484DRAFT_277968 [Ochromonadaceae sp. CCMP2298]|nr:hypothetical protein B484DRAFT_277968 [Ochromonadaceae sp. CCMP2298]